MSLCLAVSKGRSGSPGLLQVCREICALCLSSGSQIVVRWVPSELNVADAPSRFLFRTSPVSNKAIGGMDVPVRFDQRVP
eukprot:7421516-Karenia_brevis.AAC.1